MKLVYSALILLQWFQFVYLITPPATTPIPSGIFRPKSYYTRALRNETGSFQAAPQRAYQQNHETIEYRLAKLEIRVDEKTESILREMRETNSRLRDLDLQSTEAQYAVEKIGIDVQSVLQQQQQQHGGNAHMGYGLPHQKNNGELEQRLEGLTKGVKLMIATMRMLNSDILAIKSNISRLGNRTENLVQSTDQLLTKQFFNNGLSELRHHRHVDHHHTSCDTKLGPTKSELPKNCGEVRVLGKPTGIYRIRPENAQNAFMVFCDMDTRNGGWTVVQNRYDGSQEFYQDWHEYKHGFGNLGGEFWLGLDKIYQLTGHDVNELLIELEDFNLRTSYAHYGSFSIGPEVEGYPLRVLGGYTGDAGDSLMYHAGNRFSARDMDQDSWPEGHCAQAHGGGWWYRSCDTSNLNGRYLSGELPVQYIYQGMYWGEFGGPQYSLHKARMMVRPRDHNSPPMFNNKPRNTTKPQHQDLPAQY